MKNIVAYLFLIVGIVTWSFVAVKIEDRQREKIRNGMKYKKNNLF